MTTRAIKQTKTGPEMWDLDGDGRRFAVSVDGIIRFTGSRDECQRRLEILTRPTTREQQDKALGRVVSAILLALLALISAPAWCASSINVTQPVQGVPYSAAPIRSNFGAAANDINALQRMNHGASAPSSPELGQLWLETPTGQTTYNLKIWDNRTSQWVVIAYFDSLNSLWIAPVGGGLPQTILTADTTDLGTYPNTVLTVTGAGPIFSFGTSVPAGVLKVLIFSGVTNIVNNPTSMILPGGADINTVAGDMAIAVALGSGNWQVLFFDSAALPVAKGGTGRTSLTAHSVLLGEGTSPVNFAVPGTSGYPLLSTGASSDPAFGQLSLTVGVTGILPTPNGGTGLASPTIHNLVIGNGASAMTLLPPGTSGLALVSLGAGLDPHYAILGPSGGGTGLGTLTAHAVVVGNGTSTVTMVGPGTNKYPLVANGGAADPAFQPLDLNSAGVTAVLQPVNGGTGIASPALHTLLIGNGASPMTALAPGTTGYPLLSAGAGADPAYGKLNLATSATGGRIPLSTTTNYCVNGSTGNDSNTGFTPNCWLTLQHAWNVIVANVDLVGFQVVIDVADAAYAGFVPAGAVVGSLGPSSVVFNGNVGTPANVTVTTVNGAAIAASSGAAFTIQGMKLVATGAAAGYCVLSASSAYVIVSSVEFSQCDFTGMGAIDHGLIVTNGAITISNGGGSALSAQTSGVVKMDSTTVTTSGTPNFTDAFAVANGAGNIHSFASVFGGSGATGVRYNASLNGVIDTNGGGATYFPGDAGGTAATGGQYN